MCLHTIFFLIDRRIRSGSSSRFRPQELFGRRRGQTWNRSTAIALTIIPDPNAEVGHCVHRIADASSRPRVLFMQKHWDVMRSDDAGDSWQEVSGNLPTDFGFVIDVHVLSRRRLCRADQERSEHYPPTKAACVPQSQRRQRVGAADEWPAAKRCYVNVLRARWRSTRWDDCGIFSHHGRQVYASADAEIVGPRSSAIFRLVVSVEVQTLA